VSRRGAVLLTVLAALVLVGEVTAALLLARLQGARAARNAEAALIARTAALSALARATTDGHAVVGGLPVGGQTSIQGAFADATYEAVLIRSGDGLLEVRGIGVERGLGLQREVTTTLRILPLLPMARAVITVRRPLSAGLAARVTPSDSAPPGWLCPSPGPDAPLVVDPATHDSLFYSLGPVAWPALVAWASQPRAPDSLQPRASASDLVLDGVRITGTLVVDGVLTLSGGAEVDGVVVARRGVVFGPGGGAVWGALVTESLGTVSGVTPAVARVSYSSCIVGRTSRSGAPLGPIPGLLPADVW